MEPINDLFKPSLSRLSNPFVGYFITSWLLWNWELVLIIVGASQSNLEKITIIKDAYSDPLFLLAWPAASSLVLSLALPPFSGLVERYIFNKIQIWRLTNLKEVTAKKVEIEEFGANLKAVEELKEENADLRKERAEFAKACDVKAAEIMTLQTDKSNLETELAALKNPTYK